MRTPYFPQQALRVNVALVQQKLLPKTGFLPMLMRSENLTELSLTQNFSLYFPRNSVTYTDCTTVYIIVLKVKICL